MSDPAAICLALKRAGIAAVNPGHMTLITLLDAGATEAEFIGAVDAAKGKRDAFTYVLSVVKGRREDAAKTAQLIHRGPMATDAPPPGRRTTAVDRQIATMNALTGKDRSHGPAPAADHANVVDVDARVVP